MTIRQRARAAMSVAMAAAALAGCSVFDAAPVAPAPPRALAPVEPSIARPPQLEAIKQRVAAECVAGSFSGVLAVEQQGKLVYLHACGWADARRAARIQPSALFRLFSLTKTFTATAVLQLIETDRMHLDAPLATYLPQVPHEWRTVTIRNLLLHQSGIPDHTERLLKAYRAYGLRSHQAAMHRVITMLPSAEAALQSRPGEKWRYSNFGYELLAAAAVAVERRPFDQILRERIFDRAAVPTATMEQRSHDLAALKGLRVAGLVTGFRGSASEPAPVEEIYTFIQQGAGALVGGYADLMAFTRALHGGELLSPAMLARIEPESAAIKADVRYGFGWMVRKAGACTYWQHSGGTNGYLSELAYERESGITITVLSNLSFADVTSYRRELADAFIAGAGSTAPRCAN